MSGDRCSAHKPASACLWVMGDSGRYNEDVRKWNGDLGCSICVEVALVAGGFDDRGDEAVELRSCGGLGRPFDMTLDSLLFVTAGALLCASASL